MQLATWRPDGSRPKPPPLWLVSNGLCTVGPVSTTHLVTSAERGLFRGVHATPTGRHRWRPIAEIREIRALDETTLERKKRFTQMAGLHAIETLLRLSDGGGETLTLSLRVLAERLGAHVGFIHCFEKGRDTPVTRYSIGPGTETRIGCPLFADDVLLAVARAGRVALGDSSEDHAFYVGASRLAGRFLEVRGVAMVPITNRRGIVAMIELGRLDRSFRSGDARVLCAVAGVAATKLAS